MYLFTGSFLLAGLLIASLGLYALDVYATAKIDEILLEYYGPQLYDRYTNTYEPSVRLTATTAEDYYGVRSLYGYRLLGLLEQAHLAYGAAKEVLSNPGCQKRLACEIKATPADDRTWMASKLADLYDLVFKNDIIDNEVFEVGYQREKCAKIYQDCPQLSEYEAKL